MLPDPGDYQQTIDVNSSPGERLLDSWRFRERSEAHFHPLTVWPFARTSL
jgi:hypothetical protein